MLLLQNIGKVKQGVSILVVHISLLKIFTCNCDFHKETGICKPTEMLLMYALHVSGRAICRMYYISEKHLSG